MYDSNQKKVINAVRRFGPISRVELSEKIGIPQPTLTRIVEELIKQGILFENGLGHSTGGRRPIMLSFNPKRFYSFGVEIARTYIKVALVDLDGYIHHRETRVFKKNDEITSIFEVIQETFIQVYKKIQSVKEKVIGIGVGVPGPLLNKKEGVVVTPSLFNGAEIPIQEIFQKIIDVHVNVDKDANAATLAEKYFGKGLSHQNFIYLFADEGIGSGIMLNENLYKGFHGEAGSLGHTTINIDGKQCGCGKFGCLLTEVSTEIIVEKVKRKIKMGIPDSFVWVKPIDNITFDDIIEACNEGASKIAKEVFIEAGRILGIGASNIISFYDPEIIIIGGCLGRSSETFIDSFKVAINKNVLGFGARNVPIIVSDFDEDVVVLGAASLVIENTLSLFSL